MVGAGSNVRVSDRTASDCCVGVVPTKKRYTWAYTYKYISEGFAPAAGPCCAICCWLLACWVLVALLVRSSIQVRILLIFLQLDAILGELWGLIFEKNGALDHAWGALGDLWNIWGSLGGPGSIFMRF